MSKIPTLLEMLKAGAHFGHQKSRWHPKMQPYLFGLRNGVHVIDLEKTAAEMEKTYNYVRNLTSQGKVILFVGTKHQAREAVRSAAISCDMPYLVERWIGGLLTNFEEVKRRLKKYNTLREQIKTGEIERYTKKEQTNIKKTVEKMDKYLVGLTKLEKIPDALYIADLRVEKTAVTEAKRTGVKVVAICDSNVNPTKADYIIPANDDAVNSIKMMAEFIAEAAKEGKAEWEKNKAVMAKLKEEAKPEIIRKSVATLTAPRKERRAIRKEESI
jgi:small subunit ribosomal protein S2